MKKVKVNIKINQITKRVLSLRTGLIYLLLTLLLAVALTGGATNAWFTSGDHTDNTFTAGTLELQVINQNEIITGIWEPGACLENQFTVTNIGSKKMYVRASFEGFWERLYHRNTATATASYNGQTIIDSDQEYYTFGNYGPSFTTNYSPEASQGFYNESEPTPTVFPILWSISELVNSSTDLSASNTGNITAMSGYPVICSGPLVSPITGSALSVLYPNLFDNPNALNDPSVVNVKKYLGPQSCDQFYSFKINFDQNNIPDGATYSDSNGFTVTINKTQISGSYYFSFQAIFPIYHVYAKGGNQGGNFYRYYPSYDAGVYQDCGLSQPGGNWSHITFYYCKPPANPSFNLIKQVSVDGGVNWIDSDEAFGPVLIGYQPKFRFWVTNTGNVTLQNIVVEDSVFSYIGTIPSLAAGSSDGFVIDDDFWNTIIDSGNVTIALCDTSHNGYSKDDWTQIDKYFYYIHPIESGESVTICVKACLTGSTGAIYDGAQFTLYSYFEAVQTTNGLIHDNWANNPYQ